MAQQRPQHAIGQNAEVVNDGMASLEVSHVILMVPAADLGCLHGLPLQPQGTRLRRPTANSGLEESAHMLGPRPGYYHWLQKLSLDSSQCLIFNGTNIKTTLHVLEYFYLAPTIPTPSSYTHTRVHSKSMTPKLSKKV